MSMWLAHTFFFDPQRVHSHVIERWPELTSRCAGGADVDQYRWAHLLDIELMWIFEVSGARNLRSAFPFDDVLGRRVALDSAKLC